MATIRGHVVVLKKSGETGSTFPVNDSCIIGRDFHCDIRIHKSTVSPTHCKIVSLGDQYFIQNLSKTHPTLLNDVPINKDKTPLASGDRITISGRNLLWNYESSRSRDSFSSKGDMESASEVPRLVAVVSPQRRSKPCDEDKLESDQLKNAKPPRKSMRGEVQVDQKGQSNEEMLKSEKKLKRQSTPAVRKTDSLRTFVLRKSIANFESRMEETLVESKTTQPVPVTSFYSEKTKDATEKSLHPRRESAGAVLKRRSLARSENVATEVLPRERRKSTVSMSKTNVLPRLSSVGSTRTTESIVDGAHKHEIDSEKPSYTRKSTGTGLKVDRISKRLRHNTPAVKSNQDGNNKMNMAVRRSNRKSTGALLKRNRPSQRFSLGTVLPKARNEGRKSANLAYSTWESLVPRNSKTPKKEQFSTGPASGGKRKASTLGETGTSKKWKQADNVEISAERAAKRLKMETPKSVDKKKMAALLQCHGKSTKSPGMKRPLFSEIVKRGAVKNSPRVVIRRTPFRKGKIQAVVKKSKLPKTPQAIPKRLIDNSTGHANSPDTIVIRKAVKNLTQRSATTPSKRKPRNSIHGLSLAENSMSSAGNRTYQQVRRSGLQANENETIAHTSVQDTDSFDGNTTTFDFDSVKTPRLSAEMLVSPLSTRSTRTSKGVEAVNNSYSVNTRKSKRNLDDSLYVSNIKRLFKPTTPRNDLTDVKGVSKLFKTPKAEKSPKNDLTQISGVSKMSVNNSYSVNTRKSKRNLDDSLYVSNIKRLFKPTTPRNDLTDVKGVSKLFRTPKAEKSPKNDLTKISGVSKIFRTPRRVKSPKNDLTDVKGISKIFRSPVVPKSPKNDLSNVEGVGKLFRSPRFRMSPRNDLTRVSGVSLLFASPKGKPSLNDLKSSFENSEVLKSPRHKKSAETDMNDLVKSEVELKDVIEETSLIKSPKGKKKVETSCIVSYVSDVQVKESNISPVKTSPKKLKLETSAEMPRKLDITDPEIGLRSSNNRPRRGANKVVPSKVIDSIQISEVSTTKNLRTRSLRKEIKVVTNSSFTDNSEKLKVKESRTSRSKNESVENVNFVKEEKVKYSLNSSPATVDVSEKPSHTTRRRGKTHASDKEVQDTSESKIRSRNVRKISETGVVSSTDQLQEIVSSPKTRSKRVNSKQAVPVLAEESDIVSSGKPKQGRQVSSKVKESGKHKDKEETSNSPVKDHVVADVQSPVDSAKVHITRGRGKRDNIQENSVPTTKGGRRGRPVRNQPSEEESSLHDENEQMVVTKILINTNDDEATVLHNTRSRRGMKNNSVPDSLSTVENISIKKLDDDVPKMTDSAKKRIKSKNVISKESVNMKDNNLEITGDGKGLTEEMQLKSGKAVKGKNLLEIVNSEEKDEPRRRKRTFPEANVKENIKEVETQDLSITISKRTRRHVSKLQENIADRIDESVNLEGAVSESKSVTRKTNKDKLKNNSPLRINTRRNKSSDKTSADQENCTDKDSLKDHVKGINVVETNSEVPSKTRGKKTVNYTKPPSSPVLSETTVRTRSTKRSKDVKKPETVTEPSPVLRRQTRQKK